MKSLNLLKTNKMVKLLFFFLLIIVFAIFSSISTNIIFADDPVKINIENIDSSNFPLIYLYYSTLDSSGNFGDSISPDDVQIGENQILQKVWGDGDYDHVPSNIVLVIDSSGSMKGSMDNVLNSAKTIINKMDNGDSIEILDFDSTIKKIISFTKDKDNLLDSLNKIKADGGTALYDAINSGLEDLKDKTGLKIVIVLTDGKDENAKGNGPGSKLTFNKLVNSISNFKIPVYTIGFGKDSDMKTLQNIASISKGKSFNAKDPEELSNIYDNIITYVHSLHSFSYITDNGKWDSTKREIILKIDNLNYFKKFYYNAPESKFWSYCVNNDGSFDATNLAISPDGKYIIDADLFMVLNNLGERVFILNDDWSTTDAFNIFYSGNFMVYTHGYGFYGELYKLDIKNNQILHFNPEAIQSAQGDFHKNYNYQPISLSLNGKYVLFTAREDRNDESLKSYFFILYDIAQNKVIWENTFLNSMEDWDEPGDCNIANNGEVIINQDHNLFIVNSKGEETTKLMWEKTNIRFNKNLISSDGKFFFARFGNNVALFTIDGKLLWKKVVEANEKGGQISISPNAQLFATSGINGPVVFDVKGNIVFKLSTSKIYGSYTGGNGVAILDDGTIVYSSGNRIYYRKISK